MKARKVEYNFRKNFVSNFKVFLKDTITLIKSYLEKKGGEKILS